MPEAYPGYQHARTIGNIVGKDGAKSRGGWKGEDRESRMYAFVLEDGIDVINGSHEVDDLIGNTGKLKKRKKKRKRGAESESSDSSSDSG